MEEPDAQNDVSSDVPAGVPAEVSAEAMAAAARIERLRGFRNRKAWDMGLGGGLGRLAKDAAEQRRKLGSAVDAWEAAAPDAIREACALESFSRGVLKVTAPNAAARAELERWLRGGGLGELAAGAKAPLRRVATVIGQVEPEPDGNRSGRSDDRRAT